MQEEIQELLYNGVMTLLEGDKATAQDLLIRVVEMDERNEEAWLWLSGAVDSLEDQQVALENVLHINPHNPYARSGLEWVLTQLEQM